ncbi:MAG: adenosine kinase [Spirochaetota bacterium]
MTPRHHTGRPPAGGRRYDVTGLGNPLVDVLVNVEEEFLEENGLTKGIMHLIDRDRKEVLLRKLEGREIFTEVGGSAPNTISTLALLGAGTALTGSVGQDTYGEVFGDKMREKSIDSFLSVKEEEDTGVCIIPITPDKERTMNTYLGACRAYTSADLPEEAIAGSRFFYFTGYMWDTENQKQAVTRAISIARSAGALIVFDIADPFAVERHRDDFIRLIRETADIVFANAQEAHFLKEAEMLAGDTACEDARYLGRLCEVAVVKNGAGDTQIVNGGDLLAVPSFTCCVEDTTGAGDNFAAGFLYGLIHDLPLDRCGRIASLVASKTIQKIGAHAPENILQAVQEVL